MKIADIRIQIFEPGKLVCLAFRDQREWLTQFSGILRVFTDEGVEGSFITSSSSLEELARRLFVDKIKEKLIGTDPFDREKIEKLLLPEYRWPNTILYPLDMCLWDIAGKALNLPIYKLIGAYRDKILAYASVSAFARPRTMSHGSVKETIKDYADFAVECKDKGYKAFKIHPPYLNWKEDIVLCRAVRKAVGDDIILMHDPLSHPPYSREEAIKVGKEIEGLNFYWYEDPLPTTDIDGFVELCRTLDIEILNGEFVSSLYGYTELIRRHATDALRCAPEFVGGITPMIKIAHLAEAFGMKFEPHAMGHTLTQAACLNVTLAVKNCDFIELPAPEGDFDVGMKDAIRIDNEGYVHAPEKPGLGYDIDWSELNKITIKTLLR